MNKPIRLDRFLADAGLGTRSEVKKYIRQGRIRIAGIPVLRPEQLTDGMDVTFDQQIVTRAPRYVYYLLNKPAGVISATEDPREKTVLDLLPRHPRRQLSPVGRLDKDTQGLLLITDNGALAHALLSPSRHVDKVYEAWVRGEMGEKEAASFASGLDIGDDKPTLPAKLEILETEKRDGIPHTRIRLTIHEGRYHQVKRMAQAVGCEVVSLTRTAMGALSLPPDLMPGQWRELTEQELKSHGLLS